MTALLVVLHVMLMFWSFNDLLTVAEAKNLMAIPGCQSSCGNVSIPYPFGIENPDCYLEETFRINCSSGTSGLPVPILSINGTDLEVTEISVEKSTIRVKLPIVYSANCEGKPRNSGAVLVDMEGTPLAFSLLTSNYFIGNGCDNLALMIQNESVVGGCMSICDKIDDGITYSCSGINCCQTKISSFLKAFKVNFKDVDGSKLGSSRKEECRYAYVAEETWIENMVIGPYGYDMEGIDHVPAALDWGIDGGGIISDISLKRNTIKCGDWGPPINSSSNQNSTTKCFCKPGFTGNPYLYGYCEEIEGYFNRNIKAETVGIATGVGLGALSLLFAVWRLYKVFKRRRNEKLKKKYFKRNGGLLLQEQLSSGEVNVEKIKMFSSKELEKATNHYDMNRMLGQGGQGTVYKGMLVDGKIIAVKKSKILDADKLKQFINEVVILTQINHRNVVKLLGCCLETEIPLLVYEFIPNGTLFKFLHDPNEEIPLTWEMRLKIAVEIAGALSYLHSAASIPIYHRDIKSTNILLDEKYRAKIADFGTSRSVTIDETHVTTKVQGTFGYLDPEYFRSSQFTDKSDVYSFGVVIVELLTGQEAVYYTGSDREARSLVTYFIESLETDRLFDIVDPGIVMQGKSEDVMMVASLAKDCLRMNGKERPSMKEVAMVLEGIQKSHGNQKSASDLYIVQESANDRSEPMDAPWELSFTSTNSGVDSIVVVSSQHESNKRSLNTC